MSERTFHSSHTELDNALRLLGGGDCAAALSVLAAAAKKKAEREYIEHALHDRAPLYAALASDAPKARKNAARLIGALEQQRDVPALAAALAAEQTRFVRPSMILALGMLGGPAAREALSALPEPAAATPEEEKHAREERDAIRTALARLSPKKAHALINAFPPQRAELRAPAGFAPQLCAELQALGFAPEIDTPNSVTLTVDSLPKLYRARCFYEALFPLSAAVPNTLEAAASALRGVLPAFCAAHYAGEPPYRYRLEIKPACDRAAYAKAFAAALCVDGLQNDPSNYELEIRVEEASDSAVNLYALLSAHRDDRFFYRREAISASIHPVTAAALCQFAKEFVKAALPRVLDPFCGSGTLLLEWERQYGAAALQGVELSGATAALARRNAAAAKSNVRVMQKDCTAYLPDAPFDLVLSNLPFGNRVGTHQDNERLYAAFVKRLPEFLAPGGIALLYTMEYALLSRCIKNSPALRLCREARTEAGGLRPWVMVLERK